LLQPFEEALSDTGTNQSAFFYFREYLGLNELPELVRLDERQENHVAVYPIAVVEEFYLWKFVEFSNLKDCSYAERQTGLAVSGFLSGCSLSATSATTSWALIEAIADRARRTCHPLRLKSSR
jgi:hypothetical protein